MWRQCRWQENGRMVSMLWDRNTGEELAKINTHFSLGGKEKSHIFSQGLIITLSTSSGNTIRKPITGLILGAEGQRKIIVDTGSNTGRWKAVQGFWDGSSKVNRRSGCGVVIRGVVKEWITVSKIAVPLGIGTAMAAEVMGICVLTSILALVVHKSLSVKKYQSVYRHNFFYKPLMWFLYGKVKM